jgi:hypothetical protein
MHNHQSILIPEIVTLIFNNLLRDSDYTSLSRLARSTKSFSEPALDLLWQSQTSLVPLICCLPDDALYKIRHGMEDIEVIVSVADILVTLLLKAC